MSARSSVISSASAAPSPKARVPGYDWQALAGELDNYGSAVLPKLLSPEECRTIAALYPDVLQVAVAFVLLIACVNVANGQWRSAIGAMRTRLATDFDCLRGAPRRRGLLWWGLSAIFTKAD